MHITATIKQIFPLETIGNINRRNVLVEYAEHEELPKVMLITFLNGNSALLNNVENGCSAIMVVNVKTIESAGRFVTSVYGTELQIIASRENKYDNETDRDNYVKWDS
jgi:hypothetical protein